MHRPLTTSDNNRIQESSTFRVSYEYIRAYPLSSALTVLFLLLASMSEAVGILSIVPMLNVLLQDQAIDFENKHLQIMTAYLIDHLSLWQIMALTVTGLWLKGIFRIISMFFVGHVYTRVVYDLRKQIIDGLVNSKWLFFIRQPIGELSHALGFDVNTASHAFRSSMDMLAYTMQATIYIIFAAFMDIRIVLFSIAAMSIGLVLFRITIHFTKKYAWQYNDTLQNLAGQVANIFSNLKPLKAMAADDQIKRTLYQKIEDARQMHRSQILYVELSKNLQEPLAGTFLIAGLFLLVVYGGVNFGQIIFFVFVFHRILSAFMNIQNLFTQIVRSAPNYWNLKKIIADTNEYAEENINIANTIAENQKDLVFNETLELKDISFSYEEKMVLQHINLTVARGDRIVITGPSGSGKSTLLDIMTSLLHPKSGAVLVDGQNIKNFEMNEWRKKIGFVPQDPFLMHDTIYNNLVLGNKNIDMAAVENALKQAELLETIQGFENGLDTVIGEGGMRLSGGQRQRLALARALIRNPSILILDESTSALDYETEEKIVETIKHNLPKDLTIIAITHRKALLQFADKIYHMHKGCLSYAEQPLG